MELNYFIQQSNYGVMDDKDHRDHEEEEEDVNGSLSSFSEEEEEEEEDDEDGSLCSVSEEEFMEDVNSSSSSSSSLGSSSSSNGPLFEMSSLISQLPFKRGLSKHFEGKSQSFTSLSSVRSLEDLIKPERPLIKKKLKPSKSYGWGLDKSLLSTKTSSKAITKKSSTRGSFSSLKSIKRHSFTGSRPSFPPQGFGGSGLWTIG